MRDKGKDRGRERGSPAQGRGKGGNGASRARTLVDRLGDIAREEKDIRLMLSEMLPALLEERDRIGAEIKAVDAEISGRLARLKRSVAPRPRREARQRRGAEEGPEAKSGQPAAAGGPEAASALAALPRDPVVPVEESILGDAIVCLIDGERRKMLHRHLKARYGITPEAYRAHFGLPDEYPMTAPGYSKSQSAAVSKAVEEGRLTPGVLARRAKAPEEARS